MAEKSDKTEGAVKAECAVWLYYINEDGKVRWKCSNCEKICKRNPHDKSFCSHCGKPMKMES